MDFKVIAKNNIKNAFGLYKNYFISLFLVITLFGTLQIFAKDKVITNALSESSKVEFMSYVTSALFTLFTVFFIIYFNHFFLKQRSEELGIYSMLGMSKQQITLILMVENTIIIAFAFLSGIISSILLYSLIKMVLITTLKLNISILTPLAIPPFLITLVLAFLMLVVIFLDNHYIIKRLSILNISNLSQTSEKATTKSSPLTAYLGIGSLLVAYLLILNLAMRTQSLWSKIGFAPLAIITLILVILGTVLIIKSTFTHIIYHRVTDHQQLYKPTNNIFLPEALFKLKTKSNLLIILSLVISAIIALTTASFSLMNYQNASLMKTVPSAIEIDQKLTSEQVIKVRKIAKNYGGKFKAIKIVNAVSNRPIEISKTVSTKNVRAIDKQDYTELLEQQASGQYPNIDLSKTTAYLFTLYTIRNTRAPVKVGNYNIKLKEIQLWPTYAKGMNAYVVVNNQIYNQLSRHNSGQMIYTINGPKLRDNEQLYQKIKKLKVNFLSAYKTNKDVVTNNSAALLMVTFVAVLFFVFIGCILYFTILMENVGITEEFGFLSDIGYDKKQLRKIATANNLLIFAPPVIIGLLNGLMAFAGFCFEFLAIDVIKFLGTFKMIGEPIAVTCLLFFIAYGTIYLFSYHKTKALLRL